MDFKTDKISLIRMLRTCFPKIRELVLAYENDLSDGWAPPRTLGLREAKELVEWYEREYYSRFDPQLQELNALQAQIVEKVGQLSQEQREAWQQACQRD